MKKNVILILLINQLLMIGCIESNKKVSKTNIDSVSTKNNVDSIHVEDSLDFNNNSMDEKTMSPYKEVDSLVQLIKKDFNTSKVKELEVFCSNSDGDLSEAFGTTAEELFNENLNDFINYFLRHPESCLKRRLIEGLGADLFVYDKAERPIKLLEEKARIIEKAKSGGLSKTQLKFIEDIFKKVNPDILD